MDWFWRFSYWLAGHATVVAAVVSAVATAIVAWFTITLARVSNRQWVLTQDSLRLARDEFISTHRPRIILREARTGNFHEGEKIAVYFVLANIGESEGTIVQSAVDIEIVGRDQIPVHGAAHIERLNEIGEICLAPGEARLLRFSELKKRPNSSELPTWVEERFKQKHQLVGAFEGRPAGLWPYYDFRIQLYGQFLYSDAAGLQRRTAFRRELIPHRQRFYRIEGEPDLDYAD